MLYIVEVPEAEVRQLERSVREINPGAPPPVAIGRNEDGNTTRIDLAQGYYEDTLRDVIREQEGRPARPWLELGEEERMAVAAYLAGYIDWQFEGGSNFLDHSNVGFLLEKHPGIAPEAFPETDPQHVFFGHTTGEVEAHYAVLLETEEAGTMPEWNALADSEKVRLVRSCRDALEADPAADLIDVLYANLDWNLAGDGTEDED